MVMFFVPDREDLREQLNKNKSCKLWLARIGVIANNLDLKGLMRYLFKPFLFSNIRNL